MKIDSYHAHFYFNETNLEEAKSFRKRVSQKFNLDVGKLHQKPVGPHPVWSCVILLPPDRFGELVPWLSFNRGTLDFFIHPNTGNDYLDHSQYVMWLGRSYPLKMEIFKKD